jgi:hypothetical protein
MNIDILTSMGYSAEESEEALTASNDNLELAIELLCKGQLTYYHENYYFVYRKGYMLHTTVGESDFEFDLIAQDNSIPQVQPPTVFIANARSLDSNEQDDYDDVQDDEGIKQSAEVLFDDFDDSRINSLVDMGFSREDVRNAMVRCNNDVNEALSFLLSST